jgi:hypothetical protein
VNTYVNWASHRSAIVEIQGPHGPFVAGPHMALGRRDVPSPRDRDVFWIITAENPNGEPADDEDNATATEALRHELESHGWFVLDAVGGDLDWVHTERSFAVLGPTEEQAVALGRKYGQQAIFGWDHERWLLLSCVDGHRERMHWGSIGLPASQLSELDVFEQMKAGSVQQMHLEPVTWWEVRSHLQSRLMMDAPWLDEYDNGMTWWPTRLPMTVEVRETGMFDEHDNWLRIHAETALAATDNTDLGIALTADYRHRFPMGALIYEDGLLKLSCTLALNPLCRSMLVPFHTAVLMQAAVASELAEEWAEVEDLDFPPGDVLAHPTSGVRDDVDELVEIYRGDYGLSGHEAEIEPLWTIARAGIRERLLSSGWTAGFTNEEVDFYYHPEDTTLDIAIGLNADDWRNEYYGRGLTIFARVLESGDAFDDATTNSANINLRRGFMGTALGWMTGGDAYRGEGKLGSILNWYFPEAALVEASRSHMAADDFEGLTVALLNFVHHGANAARTFRSYLEAIWSDDSHGGETCGACGKGTSTSKQIGQTVLCESCAAEVKAMAIAAPWLDLEEAIEAVRRNLAQ